MTGQDELAVIAAALNECTAVDHTSRRHLTPDITLHHCCLDDTHDAAHECGCGRRWRDDTWEDR